MSNHYAASVEVRCSPAQKKRWIESAISRGLSFSELARSLFDGVPLQRASQAAECERRIRELMVVLCRRQDQVCDALEKGSAPSLVIATYLAQVLELREMLIFHLRTTGAGEAEEKVTTGDVRE